jgi:hypothetical protein
MLVFGVFCAGLGLAVLAVMGLSMPQGVAMQATGVEKCVGPAVLAVFLGMAAGLVVSHLQSNQRFRIIKA